MTYQFTGLQVSIAVHAVAVMIGLGVSHVLIPVSAPIPIEVGILAGSELAPAKGAQLRKDRLRTARETVKPSQQPESLSQSAVAERPSLKQEEVPQQQEVSSQTVTGGALKADHAEPGGSTIGPLFNADYLHNPKPTYPLIARRLRLEGTTIVRVLVSPAGKAEIVQLATSSGSSVLDQAALNAVQGWLFVPARQGDQPVPAWVDVPIRFRLTE